MAAFWDIELCRIIEGDRHFRGTYCLHIQGDGKGIKHICNVGVLPQDYTAQYLRRLSSSHSSPQRH
jgi:hypothetical protein